MPFKKGYKPWNKGLTKKTDKRVKKSAENRKGSKHIEEWKRIRSDNMKDMWANPNSVFNSKEFKLKQSGENNHQFKGGSGEYWHDEAWKLFGKNNCKICNISLKEHKEKYNNYNFDMHNTLIPKDYKIMKEDAWMTLCKSCHIKLEHQINRRFKNGDRR